LFLLTDDDVLDFQVSNTVLESRKKIGVGVNNHVGNVTVHEHGSGVLTHNHVGVDTGIRASYCMKKFQNCFRESQRKI
jgi:hypothetical protein